MWILSFELGEHLSQTFQKLHMHSKHWNLSPAHDWDLDWELRTQNVQTMRHAMHFCDYSFQLKKKKKGLPLTFFSFNALVSAQLVQKYHTVMWWHELNATEHTFFSISNQPLPLKMHTHLHAWTTLSEYHNVFNIFMPLINGNQLKSMFEEITHLLKSLYKKMLQTSNGSL